MGEARRLTVPRGVAILRTVVNRRLTTLVLALFYLAQATWLLHAGMDLFAPSVGSVAPPACAGSCCCPKDAQAAGDCCCSSTSHESAPSRAMIEAQCHGAEAALLQAFTQPVTCAFATLDLSFAQSSRIRFPDPTPLLRILAAPPKNVPIMPA